jgi:hypothetical protein
MPYNPAKNKHEKMKMGCPNQSDDHAIVAKAKPIAKICMKYQNSNNHYHNWLHQFLTSTLSVVHGANKDKENMTVAIKSYGKLSDSDGRNNKSEWPQ